MRFHKLMPTVLAAGLAMSAGAQQEETLTLDEAIRMALDANRMLKTAGLETGKVDDQVASLKTRRLPNFSFSALGAQKLTSLDFIFPRGALGVVPGIGPLPSKDATIHTPLQMTGLFFGRVAQPLTQLHKIKLNLEQLELNRQYTKEQQRAQRQAVVNDVKRVYYGILQAQSALEAVEESIKLYRELDRITAEYVVQQTALKSQNLEVKARLAKAEYDALTLRDPVATQKEQLNSLMGRDIRTGFRVSAVPEPDTHESELEAARRVALEQRPELKEARLRSRQAEQDRRIKRSEYIPDVSLHLQWISPVNYGSLIPSNIATAGMQLEWEPFDWGRKKHDLAQKDKTIGQAALAEKEAESQILIDVGNRFRKLAEARMLLAVARAGQETARENLRVATNRYQEQSALLKDVLQAQVALADSNNQYQQALLGFWTAKAEFEKALGEER